MILLGMRPQWRGQPFGTFRILFNAAFYTAQLADLATQESTFWSAPAVASEAPGATEDGTGNDS